jgi:hypothetical protein
MTLGESAVGSFNAGQPSSVRMSFGLSTPACREECRQEDARMLMESWRAIARSHRLLDCEIFRLEEGGLHIVKDRGSIGQLTPDKEPCAMPRPLKAETACTNRLWD